MFNLIEQKSHFLLGVVGTQRISQLKKGLFSKELSLETNSDDKSVVYCEAPAVSTFKTAFDLERF